MFGGGEALYLFLKIPKETSGGGSVYGCFSSHGIGGIQIFKGEIKGVMCIGIS